MAESKAKTETTDATPEAKAPTAVTIDGHDDGPITFTLPGIESRDFTVKGGTISTDAEGAAWLLANVAGTIPVAE